MSENVESVQEVSTENVSTEEVVETSAGNFTDMLAEDLRGEASLQDFKDVNGLAKSYISAQRMLGNSIRIPGEDASDEVRKDFYNKIMNVPGIARLPDSNDPESIEQFYNALGRPESPDKYDLEVPEELPVNSEVQNSFKELAHKIGLNNAQAKELAKWEMSLQQQNVMKEQQDLEQAEATLKQMWGTDYTNRMAGAKFAAQYYADKFPGAMENLLASSNGNNPAVISMLSDMAQILKENNTLQGASSLQYGMSAEEAQDQKQEILSNKSHAYWNSGDPNHNAALEKVYRLNKIISNET